jgi:magnesium-transporting ATPase (P-type)
MNTPVPVMAGGAKEHIIDILKKYAQPLNIYIGMALVLGITYVGQIPGSIAFQANTLLGRVLLFWATIIIADTYSWIYALLMALFVVLLISVSPRTNREGFSDTEMKRVTKKRKWWSEEVLHENPLGIEEELVKTQAIQDNTNSSNSTNSSR